VFSLEITGQANILAVLRTEVRGGELKFWFERNVREHRTIRATIHAPQLSGADISGSGDIDIRNQLSANILNVNISGSGNFYVHELRSSSLVVKISGSGKMKVDQGTADNCNYHISGSGDIVADGLVSRQVSVKVSGSGNARVFAQEQLNVEISGSGEVRYKGSPVTNSNISGSGRLIRI
jgi:hypothetical protein